MSEQNDNLSLDQLLEDDGFDLGGNVPDYDPFAQASDVFSGEAADAQDAEEVPSRDDPSGTIPFTPISNSGGDERQSDGKDAEDDGEQPETSTPVRPAQAPAKPSNVTAPDFNPLAAAVNQAEEQNSGPAPWASFQGCRSLPMAAPKRILPTRRRLLNSCASPNRRISPNSTTASASHGRWSMARSHGRYPSPRRP